MANDAESRMKIRSVHLRIGELLMWNLPLNNHPLDSNACESLEQAARYALELSALLNHFVNDDQGEKVVDKPQAYDVGRYGPW